MENNNKIKILKKLQIGYLENMIKKKITHKYKAVACHADGIRFDSKLERSYYIHLKNIQKSGEVIFFLRQVPFDLGGKVKFFCDFQVFYENGDIEFIDIKGFDTPLGIAKRKILEDIYPIKIKIVKRNEIF